MTLLLYHHNSSVCAAKVRVTLHEKRLEWDGKLMTLKGDQFDPSYLELNPAAVVPTLVHDDVVVTESNVILEYLDDVFSDPSLRPQDPVERAQMRYWMQHLDNGNEGESTTPYPCLPTVWPTANCFSTREGKFAKSLKNSLPD